MTAFASDVVGVDEVGYGPTLGPFVVAACRLSIPSERSLFELCPRWFSRDPRDYPEKLPVGDSKRLYSTSRRSRRLELGWPTPGTLPDGYPAADFAVLETTALALHRAATGDLPATFGALLRHLGGGSAEPAIPAVYGAEDPPLPLCRELPMRLVCGLGQALAECGGAHVATAAEVYHPARFNACCARVGGKAKLDVTAMYRLGTALAAVHRREAQVVEVLCGAVGGMRNYPVFLPTGMLMARPPGEPGLCRYAVLSTDGRPELFLTFAVDVEDRHPAPALASALAKYIREVFMLMLNTHCRRLAVACGAPPPRPTAGYPVDARRFLADLAPLVASGAVTLHHLVRQS
ncbi:MAG: hypothetical protein HYV63_02755 [Candidatus Schekmanbacteria bacterium]|nr:hypothetical protein [Candidatus Schekmanbacteria bacterium]